MCNLIANSWEMWIGDHRFLTYIFKWERLNVVGPSHPGLSNHWLVPLYNDKLTIHGFTKKHIGAQISKLFWPSTPPWEVICVNPRFLGSISHVAYSYHPWVSDEMRFCIILLTVFDALRIVEPSLMKWNRHLMKSYHIIGVKWTTLCLHVTNDSRSLKRHNEGKKTFWL